MKVQNNITHLKINVKLHNNKIMYTELMHSLCHTSKLRLTFKEKKLEIINTRVSLLYVSFIFD